VAIALSGITMGRVTDEHGVLSLQPYLAKFAVPERQVLFCFDAETKEKTKHNIFLATVRTGKLFAEAQCQVKVIQLPLLESTDKTRSLHFSCFLLYHSLILNTIFLSISNYF
jgi:hypothetical protein